jgi:hypothetical protein
LRQQLLIYVRLASVCKMVALRSFCRNGVTSRAGSWLGVVLEAALSGLGPARLQVHSRCPIRSAGIVVVGARHVLPTSIVYKVRD